LLIRQPDLHARATFDKGVKDQGETTQALPELSSLGRERSDDLLYSPVSEVARDEEAWLVDKAFFHLEKVAFGLIRLNVIDPGGSVIADWEKLKAGCR
jgi:hypothetical protein